MRSSVEGWVEKSVEMLSPLLKAGAKYTWRVRAIEGDWKGPVRTSSIVVKGAQ